FYGETLTGSVRSARAAHSSSVRPTRSVPSKTATTAGVAPAFSQASHWRRTASMAAAFGRPCVITADSRATTAAPEAMASRTAGATVSALTAAMVRGYIHVCPAGVAELVQAHGLGPCGVSHGGSSPLARTNTNPALPATCGPVLLITLIRWNMRRPPTIWKDPTSPVRFRAQTAAIGAER